MTSSDSMTQFDYLTENTQLEESKLKNGLPGELIQISHVAFACVCQLTPENH